ARCSGSDPGPAAAHGRERRLARSEHAAFRHLFGGKSGKPA
ncbi:MAG: hypothetical protein AVDCRST_MAG62-1840, partial [uncultured Sphingomonas sp.]